MPLSAGLARALRRALRSVVLAILGCREGTRSIPFRLQLNLEEHADSIASRQQVTDLSVINAPLTIGLPPCLVKTKPDLAALSRVTDERAARPMAARPMTRRFQQPYDSRAQKITIVQDRRLVREDHDDATTRFEVSLASRS